MLLASTSVISLTTRISDLNEPARSANCSRPLTSAGSGSPAAPSASDIDVMIPHQANIRIIEAIQFE